MDKQGETTNLARFHHYMKDVESPDIFIDWNFYFMIAACLARRIWIGAGFDFPVFPNIFLIFVARPGFGKTLPANKAVEIITELKEGKLENGVYTERELVKKAPDTASLEAVWEFLEKNVEKLSLKGSDGLFIPYNHSSMALCLSDELGIFLRESSVDTVTFLQAAWDCKKHLYRKTRKGGDQHIRNMCVNMLGCCAIDWMRRNMQTSLLTEGFLARAIFVFGDKHRKRTTFLTINNDQRESLTQLIKHLRLIACLPPGEMNFSEKAFAWFDDFVQNRMDKERINPDKRLDDFYGRYKIHLLKLAMLVHFSESLSMTIEEEDFKKAQSILHRTESTMHRALVGMGNNPVAILAEKITDSLRVKKEMTDKEILMDHFEMTEDALHTIPQALSYLQTVGEIKQETKEVKGRMKTVYSLSL